MEISNLLIKTKQLMPPLDNYNWVAKVRKLYVKDDSGRYEVNTQISEAWGETKLEAEENLKQNVEDWIKSQ